MAAAGAPTPAAGGGWWVLDEASGTRYDVPPGHTGLQLGRKHLSTRDVRCSRLQAQIIHEGRGGGLVLIALGRNPVGVMRRDSQLLLLGEGDRQSLERGSVFFLCGDAYRFIVGHTSCAPQDPLVARAAKRDQEAASDASDDEQVTAVVKRARVDVAPTAAMSAAHHSPPPAAKPVASGTPLWQTLRGTVVVGEFGARVASAKWAVFDMDGTLITPASGRRFAKDADDWKFAFPEVPRRLRQLDADGHKIVIISNQKQTQSNDIDVVKRKVEAIHAKLGRIPFLFLAATANDANRKPSIGMWEIATGGYSGGTLPDEARSVFVGDAAGRPAGWMGRKTRDHSDSDRKFAINVGLTFLTPEQYFQDAAVPPLPPIEFDPRRCLEERRALFMPSNTPLVAASTELVVLVGFPGSGKSSFFRKHLEPAGYVHVNQDTLKSREQCIATARRALAAGKSVAVDNTNPSEDTRAPYIALARAAGVPARCFVFRASEEQARHMNVYRELVTDGQYKRVPDLAYNMYKSRYKEPSTSEGFAEIKNINFVPDFARDADRALFQRFLV